MVYECWGKKVVVPAAGLRITIPAFDNTNLINGYGKILIGRCFNPNKQNMRDLLTTLPRIWQIEEHVVGADLGLGRFQFDFDREEDIAEVLKTEPFHFENWMLSIVRWEPVVDVNYPSTITFWVRVIGVPFHFWAVPTFRGIGEAIGKVNSDAYIDLNDGRVRVVMDGFKPLIFTITVEFHSGEETVVQIRYEKLHGFCRTCCSLRHDQMRCPNRPVENGGEGEVIRDSTAQGHHPHSYKAALQSQGKAPKQDDRQRSVQYMEPMGRDNKGKMVVRDYSKPIRRDGQTQFQGGRRPRFQGEYLARNIRQLGYLSPHELATRYAVASTGLEMLRNENVGHNLDDHQKLMIEAFKGGPTKHESGSKARKSLVFEEEDLGRQMSDINEEPGIEVGPINQSCPSLSEEREGETHNSHSLEEMNQISEVQPTMVMMETIEPLKEELDKVVHEKSVHKGNSTGGIEMYTEELQAVSNQIEGMDEDMEEGQVQPPEEQGPIQKDKEKQIQRRRLIKPEALAIVGNTKKRLVQNMLSPRKKQMAKQITKVVDKETMEPKKAILSASLTTE